MRKYLFSLLIFILINSTAWSQVNKYDIKIKINNSDDQKVLLVSYYGSSNKIIDTAFVKAKGEFEFKGDKALVGGMYLIVLENKKYFEFIVDKDQEFSLETDTKDLIGSMKVKGSKDNKDFYDLMFYMNKLQQKRSPLEKELKAEGTTEERKKEIEKELKAIALEAIEYKEKYMQANPEALFTIILKASKDPDIPKVLPKNDKGEPDSTYIYKYYRAHYFDNFDFADERLLHTRFYAQKIKTYWTKVIPQHPDTLIKEAIRIIDLAKPNKETYKYCIWYFTYKAETSNIMGMDAVFVALGKRYYVSGEAYWVNEQVLKNMTKRINTLDRILLGKPAPPMIMQNTDFKLESLYDVKANYTIVLFWDPDCGHCRTEIPRIKKWYDENAEKYGVKVFSVCSDTTVSKWKKSIKEFGIEDWVNVDGPRSISGNYHDSYDIISTPTLFLLDEKKMILAKRLSDAQITEFIERDFKRKQKEKKE